MNEITVSNETSPIDAAKVILSQGVKPEDLEKILTLQERWEANEARKAYHVAISAFKTNSPKIDKDKKVSYGNTKYSHASLANVVEKITAELSKHGLSASWRTKQNGKIEVTCQITHIKGHSEETSLSADADTSGSKNSIQALGSTITYLERYTLLAITGLATEEQDDDAVAATVFIDDKQKSVMLDILDNLPDAKNKKAKFYGYMGVGSIDEIQAKDFDKGMKALNLSKSKAEAKK